MRILNIVTILESHTPLQDLMIYKKGIFENLISDKAKIKKLKIKNHTLHPFG